MPETSRTTNSDDAHDNARDNRDTDRSDTDHPTGQTQAAANTENEPAG